ncbi:hypothetical protein SAMN05660733_03806 [Lentzea albidocapillata]|uniref:Uncharacterized protein n=2 Tax=Lentzea TaxID=165301 RepID=A0A1W2EA30_9PSEU|nr:hypothetical protein [Lentzea aerocolonigenes]GGN18555.1 hypothetical protein GCM10011609_69510 [Lentzea pudingi]SMD06633.1 hypothetical protein SAMN05660733_03806 [Lentzea albidocapillata]
MPDMVRVHVTADLPMRPLAMPFADRVELRFGKAFPVVLVVDRDAVPRLREVLDEGWKALQASAARQEGGQ